METAELRRTMTEAMEGIPGYVDWQTMEFQVGPLLVVLQGEIR
jgi:hypothetical protein